MRPASAGRVTMSITEDLRCPLSVAATRQPDGPTRPYMAWGPSLPSVAVSRALQRLVGCTRASVACCGVVVWPCGCLVHLLLSVGASRALQRLVHNGLWEATARRDDAPQRRDGSDGGVGAAGDGGM